MLYNPSNSRLGGVRTSRGWKSVAAQRGVAPSETGPGAMSSSSVFFEFLPERNRARHAVPERSVGTRA